MLVWLLASSSLSPLQTKNSSHTMPAYMWWTKSNFGIPLKALWSRISSLWTWMWLCLCAKKNPAACRRDWTFLPVSHCMLLPCDRWQQRGTLTKWRLTWKCIWNKAASLNSSMRKIWHLLTVINICWTFMETRQWVWAQWSSGWCVSAAVAVTAGHLRCCSFLQAQHTGSCSLLAKTHT